MRDENYLSKKDKRMHIAELNVSTLQPALIATEIELNGTLAAELPVDSPWLEEIFALNADFENRYRDKLLMQPSLSRSLVSFQANKGRAVYRWFKYKEASLWRLSLSVSKDENREEISK